MAVAVTGRTALVNEWLGYGQPEGDCPGQHVEGWLCTLPREHMPYGGLHEAWATENGESERPVKAWLVGGDEEREG